MTTGLSCTVMTPQRYWGHDLDLLGSCDLISRVERWIHLLWLLYHRTKLEVNSMLGCWVIHIWRCRDAEA